LTPNAVESVFATKAVRLREAPRAHGDETCRLELRRQIGDAREPTPVDLGYLREDPRHPEAFEALRREGGDDDTPTRRKHARALLEGLRAVEQMDDESEDRSVEPAVLERKRLGPCALEWNLAAGVRPRLPKHLLRGIDPPHPRAALSQRAGQESGSATHVEHALAHEASLVDERVEDFPPAVVDGTEAVVACRKRAEVRWRRCANGRR
jgi:hypothetical protein